MAKRHYVSQPPKREPFKHHGMVKWFAPSTLFRAGLEVLLSGTFARFADKRELQAALPPPMVPLQEKHHDVPEDEPVWIDFVSDVGDGFNSTYTIAWLLAQPRLRLERDGEQFDTQRGHILVLGGDEVYPTAKWDRYQERFALPYTAALPFASKDPPRLFAIPGNHDWYDGLTSFMRLFCQGDWIGGWHTRPRRSYFAVKLPSQYWLWGIDIQFDTYIDEPQLQFFEGVADKMDSGDRVILVTSKPSWVHVTDREVPQSWTTLAYFEERVIREHGGEVALTITGDIHHYCHYEGRDAPRHRITAGGGGAYMSATHTMRDPLKLLSHRGETNHYRLVSTYPDVDTSKRMRKGVLRLCLPWYTWTLGPLVGSIYALFVLLWGVGIKDQDPEVLTSVTERDGWSLFCDATTAWVFLLFVALWVGLKAFAASEAPPVPVRIKLWLLAFVHALLHVVPLTVVTLLVLEWLEGRELGFADQGFWPGYMTAIAVFLFGWLWGRIALAFYLLLTHLGNRYQHANDVFAAQSIEQYKGFVRFRLGTDGRLTAFPIGVREVVKDWRAKPMDETDPQELEKPWFEPESGREPKPELIEKPFQI